MADGHALIAGAQIAGMPSQKRENLDKAAHFIRKAAARGAQVVMTPEVVLSGFVGGREERALAEPIPGPATTFLAELARELDIYILFGLSEMKDDNVYNAMVVLDRSGEILGVMRKVHINKFETGAAWRNGSDFPVWDFKTATGSFRAGIMICYDREIPESARILMLKGADIIFNPLACECPTDDIHRCLLRTRAFENETFIFMTNHAAPAQNGHSMAFNHDGAILAELDESERILYQTFDFGALNRARADGIYGKHHRRPELYGLLCDTRGQLHPRDANLPAGGEHLGGA